MNFPTMLEAIEHAEDLATEAPQTSRTLVEACATADAAVLALIELTGVCRALVEQVEYLTERVERPDAPTSREIAQMIAGPAAPVALVA